MGEAPPVELAELHRQRIVQLPDTYVMRRMTDEICRNHQIRPRTVAEINSIEMVLRALAPLKAIALMPRVTLREPGTAKLRAIRLAGKSLDLEIGLLRMIDSGTNPAVAAFCTLAKAVVPKIIDPRRREVTTPSYPALGEGKPLEESPESKASPSEFTKGRSRLEFSFRSARPGSARSQNFRQQVPHLPLECRSRFP